MTGGGPILSDREKQRIRDLYAVGTTLSAICDELDRGTQTMRRFLKEAGLYAPKYTTYAEWTEALEAEILAAHGCESIRDISIRLRVSRDRVGKFLKSRNVCVTPEPVPEPVKSDRQDGDAYGFRVGHPVALAALADAQERFTGRRPSFEGMR